LLARPFDLAGFRIDPVISPDGRRFLLNLPAESRASVSFHAILGWPALLSK
jgi:hypothetical protein